MEARNPRTIQAMAKAYSDDLRRKLLEAHDRGEGSLRVLAKRFGVSVPWAWKISGLNIYYLHRNANAADPESWVLRTGALAEDWRGHWEAIIATKVLVAPVIVFAGLGSPVAVLIESVRLIRHALPNEATLYQVDPGERAGSRFFPELEIDASAYIQCDWGELMDQLADRVTIEQVDQLGRAADQKLREDAMHAEDVDPLLARLRSLGLVKFGKLRALWLLHEKLYSPVEASTPGLIADLVLALAMVIRVSGAHAVIMEDGLVQFTREGRIVSAYIIASGSGYRARAAVEARVGSQSRRFRNLPTPPNGVFVGGTSDAWDIELTPPGDILRGDENEHNPFPFLHVSQLRSDAGLIQRAVP
jgi:hypothetical protein